MQLTLTRSYAPTGTNGSLYIDGAFQCYTIELPWLNNAPQHSCVPEGKYLLLKRWSVKFGDHLLLADVPGRSLILFHPANNALTELKGCIAPVTKLQQPGCGTGSRAALKQLLAVVYPAMLDRPVFIIIKKAIK